MPATIAANVRTRYQDCYVPARALPQRTSPGDLLAEAMASSELSKTIAENPDTAVKHLLDMARSLCEAGSAGLSMIRRTETDDNDLLRWEALSGTLSNHPAIDAKPDHSPCGLCLDAGIAILVPRPQQVFKGWASTLPAITEVLTVPLFDELRVPFGTMWIAHHDSSANFCRNDARIAEQLAAQLTLTLLLREQTDRYSSVLQACRSRHKAHRHQLIQALRREQLKHQHADAIHQQAMCFKDSLIQDTNHRAKNTLQIASNLLTMQARASSSETVRQALFDNAHRIHILGKTHELLYAPPGSVLIVSMSLLLHSLADSLRQSFHHTHPAVILTVACEPMELPTQSAVALALITNEAITNAYKHAFPNGAAGVITVKLQRHDVTGLCLRIEDTGSSQGILNHAEGMGMTLIRALGSQLGGTLDVTGRGAHPGTSIGLTISKDLQAD